MPRKAMRRVPTLRFEYQLARELGMTHATLVASMSGNEFAHWIALYTLEHRERERDRKRAEAKGRARRMSKSIGGGG
jgi:hypothetical protein